MDNLRREALEELRQGREGDADDAIQPQADAMPAADVVVARPLPAGPLEMHIAEETLRGFRTALPATACNSLSVVVNAYASSLSTTALGFDPNAHRLATDFFDKSTNVWHASTLTARAASSGMNGKAIQRIERRLAASAELAERHEQVDAQDALVACAPEAELIAFIENLRYDEATSVMAVPQSTEAQLMDLGEPMANLERSLLNLLEADVARETVPAKVFQTEATWVAVLAFPDAGAAGGKRFVTISSETVCSPQILQRTTAAVLARALSLSSVVRPSSVAAFKWRMRLVCSDRYAAQLAAERMLTKDRGAGWHLLHFGCEVHMNSSCQAKGLLLVDKSVTAIIRFALSLKLGGWMRTFRKCLFLEVLATLEVVVGSSSEAAAKHRKRCATMFLSVGSKKRRSQAVLACLPNGDWTLSDRVQVYVPEAVAFSRKAIALITAKGLCMTLANAHFAVFNRKRWTLNDLAVSQLGILESCHRLLSRTYRRFLIDVGYSGALAALVRQPLRDMADQPPAVGAALAAEDPAAGPGAADDEEDPDEAGAGDEADAGREIAIRAAAVAPEVREDPAGWAAINEKNRSIAAEWILLGAPLRDLVVIRVGMEPTMAALRLQLHMSSDAWSKKQDGKPLDGRAGARRETRMMSSARGEIDAKYHQHMMQAITSPGLYSILPLRSRNEQLKCIAFRIACKMHGEWERILASLHRSAPFMVLLSTQQPQLVRVLKARHLTTPCRLDNFTREFMDAFDLESAEAQAILMAIVASGHVDTAKIECWHAWARRVITRLGTQTHRPNEYDVSARCFVQRLKRRAAHVADLAAGLQRPLLPANLPEPAAPAADPDEERDQPPRKRGKPGGGGAWRAHVSKSLRAGETNWGTISADFKARDDAAMQADLEDGAAGTDRHRVGLPAFGPSARQLGRHQLASEAIVFNRQHVLPEQSFVEDAEHAISPALAECTPSSFRHMLRVINRADSLLSQEERLRVAATSTALQTFARGPGVAQVQQVVDALPPLMPLRDSLIAIPADMHSAAPTQLCLAPRSAETARDAISMAYNSKTKRTAAKNLGVGLDEYWVARQRPIYEGDWPGAPSEGERVESRCFKAGHCICSARGLRLFSFRNAFLRRMKFVTPRGSSERALLADGHIVWVIRCAKKVTFFARGAGGDSESSDVSEDSFHIWHSAFTLFSPYVPVFHRMVCNAVEEDGSLPPGEIEVLACAWVLHLPFVDRDRGDLGWVGGWGGVLLL